MKKLLGIGLLLLFVGVGCCQRRRCCFKECERLAAIEMDRLKDERSRIVDEMIAVREERDRCKKECCPDQECVLQEE
jgi:hypothetical protein